jgi:hypothetical protein
MIHTYHEPVLTHGLADDCPRCQEHTERPWATLDVDILVRLYCGDLITATDRRAARRFHEWLRMYPSPIEAGFAALARGSRAGRE